MKPHDYRDMQLLNEIAQAPDATQRDLSKKIGVALGLTNLMLRRLSDKGQIKIIHDPKKSKIRYVITPEGSFEKGRMTGEFISHLLHLYGGVRLFLREQFSLLSQSGNRRMVLCGTDELAEIACTTIQEMGLALVGVVEESPIEGRLLLGHSVRKVSEIPPESYDRFVVVSLGWRAGAVQRLVECGVPADKIITLFLPGAQKIFSADGISSSDAAFPTPATTDVVVLCGGRGTRLGNLTAYTPKPLLPVGGYPFLLRLLLRLEEEGFTRIILAGHYLADQFRAFLSTYGRVVPEIELLIEPEPLGTGGALRYAAQEVRTSLFVAINGDSWVSQPITPVLIDHTRAHRAFSVVAVQAVNVEGGAIRKGVWQVGPQGQVLGFATEESVLDGWVNAGIYALDREMVFSWPEGPFSLEENLPSLLNGKEAGVFCSAGRLLDIGTPECYERASRVLESAQVSLLTALEQGVPS